MAYRAASFNSDGSTANVVGNRPTGTTDGDWLWAWIVSDGQSATIITTPSGWNLVQGPISQAAPDSQRAWLYEKVAASEPTTWTWELSGATGDSCAMVVAVSGRNTVAAYVEGAETINTTSNATPVTVTITGVTAATGDDVLWFAQLDRTATADTWSFTAAPTNYTIGEQGAGDVGWINAVISYRNNVAAGATGDLSGTATRSAGTGTAGYSGIVISLPAAASGAPRQMMHLSKLRG